MLAFDDTPSQRELKNYFRKFGLDSLIEPSTTPTRGVNELQAEELFPPDLGDLYRLHRFIIKYRRITILEFGTGWSTLVFANALHYNRTQHADQVDKLRRSNPFEVYSVDNLQNYLSIAGKRIPKDYQSATHFWCSDVQMTEFNGRIATEYQRLPVINPDFIYLDGPSQFDVRGDINGVSTNHNDMLPMACDLLKIEHFLTPGTVIVIDGRTANARFLKCNFQRNWLHKHDRRYDQHIFLLDESALGMHNQAQLDFYSYENRSMK